MEIAGIILLNIFVIGFVLFTVKVIQDIILKSLKTKTIFMLLGYSLVLLLTGLSFIFSSEYTQFGFLSIMILVFCAYSGVILSYYIKNKKTDKIVQIIFSAIFLALFILKLTFPIPFYELLPLNVCNIVAVLIIIRPLFKNSLFDNYILCFAFLGVFANFFLGDWYSYKDQFYHILNGEVIDSVINVGKISFFNVRVLESNLVHDIYGCYAIYMLLQKRIISKPKLAVLNFVWIVPIYYVLVFTNQIYKFNFFYNSEYRNPLLGIYDSFYNAAGFKIGDFKINLLYDLLIIGAAVTLLFLSALLFKYINKKTNKELV
ncbi:MAG: hypothetical protein LBV51_03005 [Acholeplasmatales bacterium]|jgi:hypothetical protein|nr:hypothetical protein [Acholeplasmatales bacterium]